MLKKPLFLNLLAVLVGMGALVLLELALYLVDAGPSSRLFLAFHRDGEVIYEVNPTSATVSFSSSTSVPYLTIRVSHKKNHLIRCAFLS